MLTWLARANHAGAAITKPLVYSLRGRRLKEKRKGVLGNPLSFPFQTPATQATCLCLKTS